MLQAVRLESRAVSSLSFLDFETVDMKILGLQWDPTDGGLNCELRLDPSEVYTKRGMLSLTALFFDPLGLFAPSILLAKHIIRRTWMAACTWNEPLLSDIHRDWAHFV